MPNPTTSIGFSPTTPAPDSGYQNAIPRGDGGQPLTRESFEVPNVGGVSAKTANYTATAADCGKLLSFNSASAVVLTLPAVPPSVGAGQWQVQVQNRGAGSLTIALTITSPITSLLDGSSSSLVLATGSGVALFTDGTNYFTERGAAPVIISTVGITIDGGGSPPTAGLKGVIQVPFAGTIIGWSALADVSGSASLDIWKVASSAPPSAPVIPTSGNKISASAPVALSSAQSASVATSGVSTWTTAVAKWDTFGFNLASASTLTRLTIELQITRS